MADIVLRDRNGNPLNFYGAEYLDALTPDGIEAPYALYDPETLIPENIAEGVVIGDVTGTKADITTSDLSVDLDFSGGDMEITPEAGAAFSKVNIPIPDTLIPGNIVEGVNIAGIKGTASGTTGSKALVFNAVKQFDKTAGSTSVTSSANVITLATAAQLAECGIDLTPYCKWYENGDAYVPFIKMTKLNPKNTNYTSSYPCICDAWISNIERTPSSGTSRYIGKWAYNSTAGTYANDEYLTALTGVSNPLALQNSYMSTNQLLYVSDGDVECVLYYSSSVRYRVSGTYLITIMLIPTSN